MTKRQREILEGDRGGQTSEGDKNVHDSAEGQRFDAFVEELQGLEGVRSMRPSEYTELPALTSSQESSSLAAGRS